MFIYIKIIKESILFALDSLWSNKMRTFLSLLGITIGIFSIISVFSIIDSLHNNISKSISTLGNDVIYVHKWPWSINIGNDGEEYPWWKYINRPLPKEKEQEFLKEKLHSAKACVFSVSISSSIEHKKNSMPRVNVKAVSYDFPKLRKINFKEGRYFTLQESRNGQPLAILGHRVAEILFKEQNPILKTIKLEGQAYTVIGVLKKEGKDMLGQNSDYTVLIPYEYAKRFYNFESGYYQPEILVKAKEGVELSVLKQELTRFLRSYRSIKPKKENNFALNQMSMLTSVLDKIFSMLDLAGLIIGGLSILVGGFGIANIMFVSVKERTKLIGIQKALGAKNFFIMFQFIFESIFLSFLGGLLGLILVFLAMSGINSLDIMEFSISFLNVVKGIGISVVVGFVSGFIPARQAASLNPVSAISSNF